jgi:abortive infection bacteriophage resistance protein
MSRIDYSKPHLSCEDQMSLLRSRGLRISDEGKVLHLLRNISYYRLSGYWYPLLLDKNHPVFKPDADFETIYDLYKFDRELRQLIMSELEKIEVAARTQISYILSTLHGSFWMEDPSLFADATKHRATLSKISEQLMLSDEEFILSFRSKYSNPLPPSFITLETSVFGSLSRLYDNLKSGADKRAIADTVGLPDKVYASWLHCFVYIRNVCAHHARTWNREMSIAPLYPRHTRYTWISTSGVSNRRMYYVLSMMIYLLNTVNPGHSFSQKIRDLFTKYANVDSRALGFPLSWDVEPLWN